MHLPRSCGILLHLSSLPSRFGIGDLGPEALRFLNFLAECGQKWWQMLPVGPSGHGHSPYQSPSSFAGSPLLISPEKLADEGWLSPKDWHDYPDLPHERADYDGVVEAKGKLLRKAFSRFQTGAHKFHEFLHENHHWLEDYSLFMALKDAHDGKPWNEWDPKLSHRDNNALKAWREEHDDAIRFYQFEQYCFYHQWESLRHECSKHEICLIGDLPIFVSHDSADVWSRPELFQLDEEGRPTVVAGVPPDFFSADGQRWGNPHYCWEEHAKEHYAWWIDRIRAQTRRFDLVRLDHFRGLESSWEIPADAPTAATGRWALGPGTALLVALQDELGDLPLIAEDLGLITFEVEALRDRFDLPGMKVLQFAFGDDPLAEDYLPYSYPRRCIVYTGTHDNDTTVGWFHNEVAESTQTPDEVAAERAFVRRYVGTTGEQIHWDLIRVAYSSVGDTVIIPMQDVLGLDSSARMNRPGQSEGNWTWRFTPEQLKSSNAAARLADFAAVYGRFNGEVPAPLRSPRRPHDKPTYLGR